MSAGDTHYPQDTHGHCLRPALDNTSLNASLVYCLPAVEMKNTAIKLVTFHNSIKGIDTQFLLHIVSHDQGKNFSVITVQDRRNIGQQLL